MDNDFDFDSETKIYEIYGKLKKNDAYDNWVKFSVSSMDYMVKEWGVENPPKASEIKEMIESFANSNGKNIAKVRESVSKDDFIFLISFLIAGFDAIINGEREITENDFN